MSRKKSLRWGEWKTKIAFVLGDHTSEESLERLGIRELGAEALRIGSLEHENLTKNSQVCAALLSVTRCCSLYLALEPCLQLGLLDSYDVIRRSLLESIFLLMRLKLPAASAFSQKWIIGEYLSWRAGKLEELEDIYFVPGDRFLSREYNDFSENAHPTKNACLNSAASLEGLLFGYKSEFALRHVQVVENDLHLFAMRILGIVFSHDENAMILGLETKKMPNAVKFLKSTFGSNGEISGRR